MLGRHARIHIHRHRTPWVAYRTPHHIVITPLAVFRPSSRRQFSFSNIIEPLNKAVGQLPDVFQHTIPENILSLSESWVPVSFPTYTTGIFVFAVLTRLCFFTPWAYWARKRKWKVQEEINPRVLAEFVHGWGPALQAKLLRERVPPAEVNKILNQNLTFRRDQLTKEANLTLAPTIIIPALFTLPVFILTTSVMYSAATLPQIAANPSLNEMFISLAGSGQDIAPALPIAIGVISLLSLEVGTWSPRAVQSMRAQLTAQLTAQRKGKGDSLEIKPNAIATGFFRFLSLVRVPICVALPGTVNIYWFTSTFFGLIEAAIFTAIEHMRAPAYWGRSSPLLKLPPAVLRARGIDLSTKTPLERAGIVYTPEINGALKKQPLSLERGARAVFIKGFQAAQFFKRVVHIVASVPASTRRVLLDLPLYRRKVVAWLSKMTLHYRKYWIPRWTRLRKMRLRDYWMWSKRKRGAVRDWSEQRWRIVASRFATGFRKAELREKIAKGEVKPPKKAAPKWMTKAQRKEALREKNRIRYIQLAKMHKRAAFKAAQAKARAPRPEIIVGLQPARKPLPRKDTKKPSLFA